MNKKHVIFIITLLMLISCTRKNVSIVEGELSNGNREYLFLDYLDINKTKVLDSLKIKKDGSFRFKMRIEQPGIYMLRNKQGEMINLIIKAGEKIAISANNMDFHTNYTVKGSTESEYVKNLDEKVQDTKNKLTELDNQYGALSTISENQASDYITRRKEIIKEQRNFSIQFIMEHLNSLASIYALYQTANPGQLILSENKDIQYMKIVADTLSVKYPNADIVKSFVADARSAENQYYNLVGINKKLEEANYGLPDIKLPDVNGDTISLSSFKGKTVLLYFWASFSKESRDINPSLLEIYEKNKNAGFEVYAISLDKEKNQWLRATRYDELEWVNVNDKDESNSKTARVYNVKSLPATFLINKSGELIARDLYGVELQKWLDNIL